MNKNFCSLMVEDFNSFDSLNVVWGVAQCKYIYRCSEYILDSGCYGTCKSALQKSKRQKDSSSC